MGFKMKGSPAKLGTIQGTESHRSALKSKAQADAASALKDLGHGGHKGLSEEEAAKRTHGGKMSEKDLKKRQDKNIEDPEEEKFQEKREEKEGVAKVTPKKPYVKPGGKATGQMKDYPIGSKERYQEYEARGWGHDATTKGGEPDAAPAPAPDADAPKKTKDQKRVIKQQGKVSKATISLTKQEGKLAAKSADSEGGSKITGKERAKIKEVKLAGKVVRDVQRGKKGLGSKIRKYRAARKLKKNIKKYGESGVVDKLKDDLTT